MKTILKVCFGLAFLAAITKACEMDYNSSIVDSIPVEIRDRIIEYRPECVNMDLLAKFWIEKGDSVVKFIAAEQEYEENIGTYTSEY